MELVAGYVDHIIFQNRENWYTVLELVSGMGRVTCVGSLPGVSEGMDIELEGDYSDHPSYGRQFKAVRFAEKEPEDESSIERYLGSGAVKGVGAALAARIVGRFGKDAFRIIEEEPERLVEVKGISERKAQEISRQVEEKRSLRSAMLFLQQFGVSPSLAQKIYAAYGDELYSILRQNPYRLADDVAGVGFLIADGIAEKAGIAKDSDFRIRSGIIYCLRQAAGNGHTYLPQDILIRHACDLLHIPDENIEKNIMDLGIERRIVLKRDGEHGGSGVRVYLSSYYNMEANIARMLMALCEPVDVSGEHVRACIDRIEKATGIVLAAQQRRAVEAAAENGVLVITGGPGTGKTTTINSVIHYFDIEGMDFMLAAPTGRAAKRLSEATGYEAATIHRMLELGADESAGFGRDEDSPIEADAVIIDETSMVDLPLMNALLKAVARGTRLILAGDADQLPSVGPGRVLGDIIDSAAVPVVKLTEIFRQAKESDIIVNAHRINRGEIPALDNKSRDFFFLKRYNADQVVNVTLQLVLEKMPGYVGAGPMDIQVLTPTRKGLLGVERLNAVLQHYLNPESPGKAQKERANGVFREGDKVMQIKNNYQLAWTVRGRHGIVVESGTGVFNGDVGVIRVIDSYAHIVTVEFDEGHVVEYPFTGLDELELAYAVTIHKSQGSEYPAVVIPLMAGPRPLMNRNLLYTAVTRARKCVTIVGDDRVFAQMVENGREQQRFCGLCDRLTEFGGL